MSQKTYRIGEAATKLNLKGYVLRFWETEFPQIAPLRTEKGQRLYTESDLAVLSRIRYLLHERGLTIDGARRLLREEAARGMLYTNTELLANGDTPDEPACSDDFNDDFDDDSEDVFDRESENIPETTTAHGSPLKGPIQASLFPPETNNATMSLTELSAIVAELEAIRSLLVYNGEQP